MFQENQFIPFQTAELPAGPWLVFAPHPDDETLGLGGTLLLGSRQGIDITLVILTDGALGGDEEGVVAIREAEAREAARRLAIGEILFWRQEDRRLRVTESLIKQVADLVGEKKPAAVFFTSPLEPHPDHRATAALVWEGLKRCAEFSGTAYAYEVSVQSPVNRLIDISSVIDEKRAVMSAYASQLALNQYVDLMQALNKIRTYTLPAEVTHAEGLYAYERVEGRLEEKVIGSLSPYWHAQALPARQRLVSVIIRTKDRPNLLEDALRSVAVQTYSSIEVIVVNDGGQDVGELVSAFEGTAIPKVRYIDLQPNQGRSSAANAGLREASGEYLNFLDDDDWFLPNHLSALVEMLDNHAGAGVAYSSVECIQKNASGEWERVYLFNQPFDPIRLLVENYIPIHAALFRRELLESGCCFDEALNVYEDWDFWVQLSQKTYFFHVVLNVNYFLTSLTIIR